MKEVTIMSEINIIVCNNKIYFDSETISEIRELTEDSDYYPYKMDLDRIEATVNNGRFHNVTEVLNQINFICLAYEGDRDSEYLSLEDDEPDNSNLTEHDNKVLDSINKLPDDSIFKKLLRKAKIDIDISTLHELVNIYELVDCGVFSLKQGEECVYKHLVHKHAKEVKDME